MNFAEAQSEIRVVKADQLMHYLNEKNASVKVVNFMASWCRPCVAELPVFKNIETYYADSAVEFTYVSLDFVEDTASRLRPLINKNELKGNLFLLNEQGGDWIEAVHTTWDGAIPVTLVIGRGGRTFVQGSVTENILKKKISEAKIILKK